MKVLTLALVSLLAFDVAGAQTQPAPGVQEPVFLPGGLTDATGKVVYLTDHGRKVVAIDAEKGDVLWESEGISKPLARVGDRLLALKCGARALRIAELDVATGRLIRESDPVELPEWVDVGTGLDHSERGRSFATHAQSIEGGLLLKWSACRYYYGGANPPPELLKQINRTGAGTVKLTFEPFRVEHQPDEWKGISPFLDEDWRVNKLPAKLQELAKRQRWELACVIGERAYGLASGEAQGRDDGGAMQVLTVQAVDIETGELVWKRAYEERAILGPPPP